MVIYVDVFLALNILLNGLLLLITAKLSGEQVKWPRLTAAAAAGGVYALGAVGLNWEYLYWPLPKFLASLLMLRIVFYGQPFCRLLRLIVLYYLVCFAFGGAVIAWYYFRQSAGTAMTVNSLTSWPDLLAGVLLASCALLVAKTGLVTNFWRRFIEYQVEVIYENRTTVLKAIVDTGNALYSLSRKPVIIADYLAIKTVFSSETTAFFSRYPPAAWLENIDQCQDQNWLARIQVIPFHALSGSSMLLAFRPDAVVIRSADSVIETADVIIGVYAGSLSAKHHFTALLHPAILQLTVHKGVNTCVSPG